MDDIDRSCDQPKAVVGMDEERESRCSKIKTWACGGGNWYDKLAGARSTLKRVNSKYEVCSSKSKM